MPVKVLFYTHGLVDGGGERLWACLATAFKQRGYDVLFAQDFEADDNRNNLDPSIPLFTLGSNHIKSVAALTRLLDQERPDVALSAVGGSGLKLLLARARAQRATTRTIITYHGANEWTSGLLSFMSYAGIAVMSRMADAVVAVADDLRVLLIDRWKAAGDKVITILNPVFFPKNAAVPTRAELMARPKTILAVGRLAPEKDLMTLLRSFAMIDRPAARLLILGKGAEEVRLRREIERLGLGLRVTLGGYNRDPWEAYRNARAFVISSKSEAFGNVVVEALAHGLPVVSTATTGPTQILADGRYGRIVPIGNPIAMAEALRAAIDDDGDPAGRRRRADAFSFDARVPAYEALVRNVLGVASGAIEPTGADVALLADASE